MSLFLLIVGLILFIGLVIVHEFGHFIAARRNGIEVEEFGLGIPPRAKVITRKKGTAYTLNWLPFGGFVKLKGEHDADTQKGSFGAASLPAKVKVMVAGVGMNLATALIIFTILAIVGMPKILDNQFTVKSDTKTNADTQQVFIDSVDANSPAQRGGLTKNDQIVALGAIGQPVTQIVSQDQLSRMVEQLAGQTIQVTIKQANGKQVIKTISLPSNRLGVLTESTGAAVLQRSTWSAPIVAAGLTVQLTEATFKGLGTVVSSLAHGQAHEASQQVSGPVGIVLLLKQSSTIGYQFVLFVVAIISLTLAIMNILPIPALDGGRLFLILLYRLIKKPLTAEREELINGIGFFVLMALIILVTVIDIKRHH